MWYFILLGFLGLSITLYLFIRAQLLLVTVQGHSMSPALVHGERILVLRRWPGTRLHSGQIVIGEFKSLDIPTSDQISDVSPIQLELSLTQSGHQNGPPYFVKRLVGLPGDTISIPIAEVYEELRPGLQSESDGQGNLVWHIPPGHCFVRGDGVVSIDSVLLGPIPLNAIRGVMLRRIGQRPAILRERGTPMSGPGP